MPTKTFETPGTVDLRLRVPTGDMRVTAVADNQTVVDYDGEDAEQRVTVSHHAHGDRHEVIVEVDSRRRGFGHGFAPRRGRGEAACAALARVEPQVDTAHALGEIGLPARRRRRWPACGHIPRPHGRNRPCGRRGCVGSAM